MNVKMLEIIIFKISIINEMVCLCEYYSARKYCKSWKRPQTAENLPAHEPMEQPITVGCLEGCDWLLHRFIEVNFSKLTDSNQIFRNDCLPLLSSANKFQLKLMRANFFLPMISCNELSITLSTLWLYQC